MTPGQYAGCPSTVCTTLQPARRPTLFWSFLKGCGCTAVSGPACAAPPAIVQAHIMAAASSFCMRQCLHHTGGAWHTGSDLLIDHFLDLPCPVDDSGLQPLNQILQGSSKCKVSVSSSVARCLSAEASTRGSCLTACPVLQHPHQPLATLPRFQMWGCRGSEGPPTFQIRAAATFCRAWPHQAAAPHYDVGLTLSLAAATGSWRSS